MNYLNGLTWGRIPGMRFLLHPNEKVTWGVSLENASPYYGGSGGGGIPTSPAALATSLLSQTDQANVSGIAVPTVHPDIISKLAFDPNSHVHAEFTGVESTVKIFNPTTQNFFTKAGGGGSFNGIFEVAPGFRLVTNNFWSDGEGRYLFGVVPNFIVHNDGSPSMIHSGSTIQGFEYTKGNSLWYGYYGGIYAKKNTALDANGTTPIGYGYSAAGSYPGHNRATQEGTVGLIQTLWRDSKYGAMQLMFQYAYFMRDPFFVPAGLPKNTHENVVWFNVRYALPGAAPAVVVAR